jgi:hypothetical protein
MNAYRRFAKTLAWSTLMPLACVTFLSFVISIGIGAGRFFPAAIDPWRLVGVYYLPFAIIVGAPVSLVLSQTRLSSRLSAFITAAATLFVASVCFPVIQQCDTSFNIRRTILGQLSTEEALTLQARHTLSDDWNDEKLHFPLSRYCSQYFDYKRQGEMENVSIHEGEVFYGKGPVR